MELIRSATLEYFPSASAIEYDNGKLFVLGDDAPHLLILDTTYRLIDTVRFSSDTGSRISKSIKTDIESAALIRHNNEKYLYALSSFSATNRTNLYYFPLNQPDSFLVIDYSVLAGMLQNISSVNIEGLAFMQSKFIMANRANSTHKTNQIIITGNVLQENKNSPPLVMNVRLDTTTVKGISGLYYLEEKDILFFTASEENTPDAISDGTIADSYIGWIRLFSHKLDDRVLRPDDMVRLSTVDKVFGKQKIESLCIENVKEDVIIMHLVADNDDGKSSLFKIRLTL